MNRVKHAVLISSIARIAAMRNIFRERKQSSFEGYLSLEGYQRSNTLIAFNVF